VQGEGAYTDLSFNKPWFGRTCFFIFCTRTFYFLYPHFHYTLHLLLFHFELDCTISLCNMRITHTPLILSFFFLITPHILFIHLLFFFKFWTFILLSIIRVLTFYTSTPLIFHTPFFQTCTIFL